MTEPAHITDHAARAVASLLSVCQDEDAALTELVTILGDTVQDLEDAIWEVLVERYIAAAEGVQLDQWGVVLGRPRAGLSDTDYRRVLAVWQGALRSQGRRPQIIEAIDGAVSPTAMRYHELTHATYQVDLLVPSVPMADGLAAVTADVADVSSPAGVRAIVVAGDDADGAIWDETDWDGSDWCERIL